MNKVLEGILLFILIGCSSGHTIQNQKQNQKIKLCPQEIEIKQSLIQCSIESPFCVISTSKDECLVDLRKRASEDIKIQSHIILKGILDENRDLLSALLKWNPSHLLSGFIQNQETALTFAFSARKILSSKFLLINRAKTSFELGVVSDSGLEIMLEE